jgi:YVTN family beta-propeller protein
MSGFVDVIDIVEATRVASLRVEGMPVDMVFDPDLPVAYLTTMAAISDGRGSVVAIDLDGLTPIHRVDLPARWAKAIALRPGNRQLWVTTWWAGSVAVLDIDTLRPVTEIKYGTSPRGIAFSPGGDMAYVADYYGRSVFSVDAKEWQVVGESQLPYRGLSYKGNARDIVVDEAGSLLVSNMGRGSVHRYAPRRGRLVHTGSKLVGGRAATLRSLSSGHILCACHGTGEIWRLHQSTLRVDAVWKTEGLPYGIDVDVYGRTVVVAGFDTASAEIFELS